jgi:hypothetical protein
MKRTGFCSVGSHEGQRPKSPSGKPLPTCKFWEDCTCWCHKEITEMCQMAGIERVLQVNPEYKSEPSPFWMPSAEFLAALRAERDGGTIPTAAGVERSLDGTSRPAERVFTPTPSGYRARGQLENDVKQVCDRFDTGTGPISLPLSFIATQIHPDAPPSVGAIREVLLRWVKYGFATMGVEPLAFTGYTDEGREKGVDVLKYKYDQNKRMTKAKADRGYRA